MRLSRLPIAWLASLRGQDPSQLLQERGGSREDLLSIRFLRAGPPFAQHCTPIVASLEGECVHAEVTSGDEFGP